MKLVSLTLLSLLVTAALSTGCSGEHSAGDGHDHGGAANAQNGAAQHGAANAVPGSYEDWCAEHAVPESKCTRCDASLVAAFKATNDWCAEHGLPESQCLECNPGLEIERPPEPAGRE
jgi:hypothetical protein